MKLSLKWLKELVPFTGSVDDLAESLTMAGVEVEGIHPQGAGLEKVIVAKILKSEKHPHADRLSVCEVETGSGVRHIVCGAANYKVGDHVPLAQPGVKLPNGMEIRKSKIRGVESEGMMCSSKELGLAEDAQGLLILSPETRSGDFLTKALGLDDVILDLEITPNRSDLLSHWGLAREIAALAGLPSPQKTQLLSEEIEKRLCSLQGSSGLSIQVEDALHCSRYTGRVIRGVKVGPSPDWLRRRLESLGQRSISNVVDITNYILLEMGQPLHAFDLKTLKGPKIIVRPARNGEKILRLDEVASELRPDMLVIADAEHPIALAGVIGGKETAVGASTADLLLESATFQPSGIRKTSKLLGVSTDSSYRFERGVDPELAGWASLRATALILEVCGGEVEGPLFDVRSQGPVERKISCRPSRVQSLLGVSIPPDEIGRMLERLGCDIPSAFSLQPSAFLEVTPPSWRPDLEREVDLIEEVGRLFGIDKIPAKMAPISFSTSGESELNRFAEKIRVIAAAEGFDEAQTYTVLSSAEMASLHDPAKVESLRLANPISEKMDTLRCSLLSGLLAAAARNMGAGHSRVSFFELGKVFDSQEEKIGEHLSLGLISTGKRKSGAAWEGGELKPLDFFDLKGALELFLDRLVGKAMKIEWAPPLHSAFRIPHSSLPTSHSALGLSPAASLLVKEQPIGWMGQVDGRISHRLKFPDPVFYAELDCGKLLELQPNLKPYRPWPAYPSVRRDIALVLGTMEKNEKIEKTLWTLGEEHGKPKKIFLQEVELFDIYHGKGGADRKSVAYALIYQSPERTLTDAEVNEVHETIKKSLKNKVPCEIRE